MKGFLKYILAVGLVACVACSDKTPSVPDKFDHVATAPSIYPDYVNVTVPCNIAPLTFRIEESCSEAV